MKRTLKKSLALLLTLCMVLGMFPAMTLPALAATTNYNVWIGGTQVTSEALTGTGWSYDPDTKTLTLSGTNTITGVADTRYGAGIYAEYALTIDLAEGADITVNAGAAGIGSVAIYGAGNLFIQGSGALTANGDDIASGIGYSAGIASQTLEVTGTASVTATGGSVTHIDGRSAGVSGTVAQNSLGFAVVTVSGGSLTATGDTISDSYAHGIYGNLTTTGTVLSGSAAPGSEGSTDYSTGASAMNKAYINASVSAVTTFPVWVGGVQVTENNADDVLGDGKVSYTPAAGDTAAILALNNATITGIDGNDSGIDSEEALVINLTGDNTIDVLANDGHYGIRIDEAAAGPLTLSGTGKLTVSAKYYDMVSMRGDLVIESGVTFVGTSSNGFAASGNVDIAGDVTAVGIGGEQQTPITIRDGAKVTATTNGIMTIGAAVTIEGGEVNATGTNEDLGGYGIVGSLITIYDGTVTAQGRFGAFGKYENRAFAAATPVLTAYENVGVKAGADETAANAAGYVQNPTAATYQSKYVWIGQGAEQVSTPALASLTVSNGDNELTLSPTFTKSVSKYSVSVPNGTESVTIDATPDTGSAIVSGTGLKENLAVGANTFAVVVTKGDQTLNYTVTVTRQPVVATGDLELKSFFLTPTEGNNYARECTIDHTAGTIKVDFAPEEMEQPQLKVTFETVQPTATVTYHDNSGDTPLTSGTTFIDYGDVDNATVIVSYGGEAKTYTLTVTEAGAAVQNYGLGVKTAANGHYNAGETVTYELYATAPNSATTTAMDIGSFQFTMSYDDTHLNYVGFTPAFGADANVDNHATDGRLKLGYVAKNAVPVPYDADVGSGYVKLGDITFTVDSNIPETTTALTDAALTAVEVTPNGYDDNSGEITKLTDADTVSLHNNIATFENTATTTGAAGKAYIKYGAAGLFTDNTYETAFTLPTVAATSGYRLANGNGESLWHVVKTEDSVLISNYTPDTLTAAVFNDARNLPGNVTVTANTVEQVNVTFNVDQTKGGLGYELYQQIVPIDKYTPILDSDPTPDVTDSNYTFAGWTTENGGTTVTVTAETLATEAMTLYAVFAPKTHTLTIEDVGTNHVTETGITNGQTITYNSDVSFTLASENAAEYSITAVEYKVGTGNYADVPESNGTYTIPGTAITDDITLRITTNHYHTLTYLNGLGITDTAFKDAGGNTYAVLYVKHNEAGLYSDKACTQSVTIVNPAVDTTTIQADGGRYRAINDLTDQPWINYSDGGSFDSNALNTDARFTASKNIMPFATIQYQITYAIGEVSTGVYGANFGTDGENPIRTQTKWLDSAASIKNNAPTPTLEPGFTAGAWVPTIEGATVGTAAATYTYTATVGKYNVSFIETAVTYSEKTGLDVSGFAAHGTDVTFKVAEKTSSAAGESSYHLSSVGYSIVGGKSGTLTPDVNGVYTIPGGDIVGAVTITPDYVNYVTVTFTPGAGATFTGEDAAQTVTAYALYNKEGLFTDTACETPFNGFPTVAAKENYKLKYAEQYWIENVGDIGGWTNSGVNNRALTGNTTYTVNTYQTVTIHFNEPVNGTIANYKTSVTFTPDMALGTSIGYLFGNGNETANANYTYTGWTHDNGTPDDPDDDVFIPEADLKAKTRKLAWLATGVYTFTANFEAIEYNWLSPTLNNATLDNLTGATADKVTCEDNITFTLAPPEGQYVLLTGDVTYTVGGVDKGTLTAVGGTYTIPKENITGNVKVTVNATQYYIVTFEGDAGANVTGGTAYAKADVVGLYTSTAFAAQYYLPTATAKENYRLINNTSYWKTGVSAPTNPLAIEGTTFTANTTYTATTVATVTVNFTAPVNGKLNGGTDAPTAITLDQGTALGAEGMNFPAATANTGYTYTGWTYVTTGNDTPVTINAANIDATVLEHLTTGSYTFTPVFAVNTYDWLTPTLTNASISEGPSNVTNGKVTYGQNVTFKLTASAGAAIRNGDVRYSVGDADKGTLTPNAEGLYTIPGDEILGDVQLTVSATEYVTVTFAAGTGNTLTGATVYAVKGTAGLYETMAKFIAGTSGYTVPVPTASTGYRLMTNAGESLWSDGTNGYTSAVLNKTPAEVSFSANTTLTAQSMKQWTVTFAAGDNGTLDGTASKVVDTGYVLAAGDIPTPTPSTGYVFDSWSATPLGASITNDITYTASFKHGEYKLYYTSDIASFTAGNGVTGSSSPYNITHANAANFSLAHTGANRITGVTYSVANGLQNQTLAATGSGYYNYDGSYSIPAANIVGDITVTVTAVGTHTVTFSAGEHGTVSGETQFVVDTNTTLGAKITNLNAVTKTPATGYEFKNWHVSTIGGATISDAQILDVSVTADVTYVAEFGLAERTITDTNNVIGSTTGTTGTSPRIAKYGTDVVITLNDKFVTGVTYTVEGTEGVFDATYDPDTGTYTIPGDAITGNIEVIGNVLEGVTVEFIERSEYKAITPETLGRKILVLNGAVAGNTYKLADGTTLYWSEKYNAAVCWVLNDATAASLMHGMVVTGTAAKTIGYNGDINRDGSVTAADAGIISDCLHDQRLVPTSAMQLFMLDVEGEGTTRFVNGYKQVTASDITWTLDKAVNGN